MRMYHWWQCEGCEATTPRKDEAPPQRCVKCLQNTNHAYLGHAPIVPGAMKEQPQAVKPSTKTVTPPPPASITVIVEGGRIKNIEGLLASPGTLVETYDYDVKKYDKDHIEKDDKGRPCRAIKWSSGGDTVFMFKVRVENNEVKTVAMSPNCEECLVKTFAGKGGEPQVKRWTPPKK